jgi:ParB family chromosome partitioning protein
MLVGQPNAQELAEEIIARGLNVRQVEALAREVAGKSAKANKRKALQSSGKSVDTIALEKRLSDALGLVVNVDHRGDDGVVSIRYRNMEQLDDIVRKLGGVH